MSSTHCVFFHLESHTAKELVCFRRVDASMSFMAEQPETLSGDATLGLPEFGDPPADPLPLLERWLQLADERGVREPRALALATADVEGRPSSRILLLKQVTPALVFSGS